MVLYWKKNTHIIFLSALFPYSTFNTSGQEMCMFF